MDLVEINKSEVVCDSSLVAKKFGVKHHKVIDVIENMLKDYPDITDFSARSTGTKTVEKCWKEDRNYRGKDYVAYLMNREFFSLLVGRFTSKTARDWQRKFNASFYAMEDALKRQLENSKDIEWKTARNQLKLMRTQHTDVIKEFVEYAISQGSKSANFYYKNLTNAEYKALDLIQHKKPKLRDTLDAMEIAQLMLAEKVATRSLRKHMEEGEHYKTVFVLVKQDLEALSKTLLIEDNKQ